MTTYLSAYNDGQLSKVGWTGPRILRFLYKLRVDNDTNAEWPSIVSKTGDDEEEILPIKVASDRSVISNVADFKRCLDANDLRGAVASALQHSWNDETFDGEYKVQYQI